MQGYNKQSPADVPEAVRNARSTLVFKMNPNMSEKQLRLRDLTEKIQREEAERMRRGGRPMDPSTTPDPKSDTPEKAADENVAKPASEESPPTEQGLGMRETLRYAQSDSYNEGDGFRCLSF